jgi:hypothetical protein
MSYLNFDLIGHSQSGLTKIWRVLNEAEHTALGTISWHGAWRKYDFETMRFGDRFDHHCLREIADFCERVTKEHRAA